MKFTRDHTRNRTLHRKGSQWTGGVDGGRFLYHRGILEPDGSPGDELITGPKPPRAAWHGTTEDTPVETKEKRPARRKRDTPPSAGEQE